MMLKLNLGRRRRRLTGLDSDIFELARAGTHFFDLTAGVLINLSPANSMMHIFQVSGLPPLVLTLPSEASVILSRLETLRSHS
ncbi:MAG: hypothetical protein AB1813_00975 [Verrucomicrobiota bacterium]|jgi:hypothetical protein